MAKVKHTHQNIEKGLPERVKILEKDMKIFRSVIEELNNKLKRYDNESTGSNSNTVIETS